MANSIGSKVGTAQGTTVHSQLAYEIVTQGMARYEQADEQLTLLHAILVQTAVFLRMIEGDVAYQNMLDTLAKIDVAIVDDKYQFYSH
ncbi:hypothetical protein [Pseudomonas aeruginosa]|uniref:hypothetical protein n=1 Tax=Pseudomonas aeruginosa TaxID=287 RepID=UPI000F7ED673|nr:hypothetical protein [Pseudomonas aeruginosa]RTB44117.1 hypothetical protein EJ655_08240 [Pseudomonas aeruginosa]